MIVPIQESADVSFKRKNKSTNGILGEIIIAYILIEGADVVDGLEALMLGKPTIFWRGKRVTFPFSKMEGLLYYLLVKGHATREEVAGLLWSDMDDVTAKKNLRNTLYLLKKLIPGELLLMPSRSIILLNKDVVNPTDVQRFECGLENSLDLWGGDFLEGFFCKEAGLFEDWMSEQREWLKEEYTRRLTKHIIDLINGKKYSKAKHYLKRLIGVDEYNESAYRALMKIYEREGDSNKIVEIYHQLVGKLKNELGIETNSKTQEIYDRTMRRKTSETAVSPKSDGEVFFGRDKEICWLRDWIKNFGIGRKSKQLAVLHGEQGVGKSAIVTRLLEMLPLKDMILLQTQCYQAEVNYPYKAWSNMLLQIMDNLTKEQIVVPELWRQVVLYMFPVVADSDDFTLQNWISNSHIIQPTMVEDVMCGLLGKLAGLKKIVLVVEDIQWMDSQGLSILKKCLRAHLSQTICITTCRSEFLDHFDRLMGEWERGELIKRLPVERFSQEDVAKFSTLVLSADKVKPELKQKLYEYTEGNALFLVECFKVIQMGQDIGRLSSRLQSVLKERVSDLSEKGRKVLDVASVFFRDATYEELVAVCGLNEFELVEVIEELQQKKLVVEASVSGIRGPTYKFCHTLIRDYVYSQMSSSRQKMIHHRIGVHLEKLMSSDFRAGGFYFAVRHHYSQAGEKLKVLEYTIKIAEKYSCPHYEMYPELSDYLCGNEIPCDQLQITEHLEQVESLIASLQEEAEGKERLSRFKAAYLEMLGRYCIWRGEHRSGLKAIHRLLRLATARNYLDYKMKSYQQVIYCGIQIRKPKMIERFADKLLKKANEATLKETTATALRFKGLACAMQNNKSMAEQYYRHSIAMFKRLDVGQENYAIHIAAAYNYIGDLRRGDRNLSKALDYYEKAIKLYRKRNIGEGLSIVYINAGYTAFQLEDYAKACDYLAGALNDGGQFGDQRGYWRLRSYCTLHCVQALISVRGNRPQEGRCHLEKADEFFVKYNDLYQKGIVLRTKTEIRIAMHKDERVREVFGDYLKLSVQEYYRQGKEIFEKLGNYYEMDAVDAII